MAQAALTYKDYEALPADGQRYEIHEGELSVTPAPTTKHQRIALRLAVLLDAHVKASSRGEIFIAPIDVILSETTVVQPDLVYVGADRKGAVSERGIEGSPTLVIEILSPSTRVIDRQSKVDLYARHGVPHYWIVDPDVQAVEAYSLVEGRFILQTRAAGDGVLRAEPLADRALALGSIWPDRAES